MFPTNTENDGPLLHPSADQFMSFDDDVSPCSKQHPSCFFNFSPTFDHCDGLLYHDHDPFLAQISHQILTTNTTTNTATMAAATAPVSLAEDGGDVEKLLFSGNNGFNLVQKMLRRRSALTVKKDRHSKIFTAQGPRDRRMRLSLEIARRFFDLQDMLGFDKASKTVEWLLSKSKVAIDELAAGFSQTKKSSSMGGGTKSVSSPSECEVVSGIEHTPDNVKSPAAVAAPKAKRVGRQTRKAASNSFSRESRAIARAKAKKRTIEKMWSRTKQWSNSSPGDLTQLRSTSSPLETCEESGCHTHDLKSSLDMVAKVDEPSSQSTSAAVAAAHHHRRSICEIDEQSLTCKSDPLSMFEDLHQIKIVQGVNSNSNHLLSFQNNEIENWDMDSTKINSSSHAIPNMHSLRLTGNSQERAPNSLFWTTTGICLPSQFTGIQFYGKPYEA